MNHATPALCAKCHASEAPGTGGYPGVAPLTRVMHAKHATATNPTNQLPLDAGYPSPAIWPRRNFTLVAGLPYQSLTFPRGPIVPPDAATATEVSGNLQTWTPATAMTTGPDVLQARDPVSSATASRRFIRLKITRPGPTP